MTRAMNRTFVLVAALALASGGGFVLFALPLLVRQLLQRAGASRFVLQCLGDLALTLTLASGLGTLSRLALLLRLGRRLVARSRWRRAGRSAAR